jgi:hypothetical protein
MISTTRPFIVMNGLVSGVKVSSAITVKSETNGGIPGAWQFWKMNGRHYIP